MRSTFLAFALVLAVASASAAEPKTRVLVSGLDNPCGIAVQPGTGDVFVTDSAAARILRVTAGDSVTTSPVITGFGQDIYGKGPMYNIGPLGLAFLNQNTLIVGDGGQKDGSEVAYVFEVPKAGASIDVSKAKAKLGPITPGDDSVQGEGNYYGVAITDDAVYFTSNGDDTKGWIVKAARKELDVSGFKPAIATKPLVQVDAPVGITTGPKGQLVVGQMGEMNVPQDSLLTMYDADGKLTLKATTGLFDIAGLAYSPKSGKLYAVDFAWLDTKQGGLYRLDVEGTGTDAKVTATKILSLDKPTSLAFSPEGKLYIGVFGTAAADAEKKPGQLLEVTGDL